MIKGLAHVCLLADDLVAAEKFYCGCLGLRKAFEFIREGAVFGFYLEAAPGSFVEIFKGENIDKTANSPIRHICLEVDDIDLMSARLAQEGYEVTEKKLGSDKSWQIWTTDPSGVRIEFHQYTPQSSQLTGEDCRQ